MAQGYIRPWYVRVEASIFSLLSRSSQPRPPLHVSLGHHFTFLSSIRMVIRNRDRLPTTLRHLLTDKLLNQLASTVSATLRSVSSRNGSLYSTLCAVCCFINTPRMLNGRCESLSRHLPTRWGGYRPESVYGYTPPAKGTRASVSIPRGGQCPCYRSEQGTSRRACPPSYGSVSDVTRIVH